MHIVHSLNPFNPLERKFYFAPDEYTIDEFIQKNQIDVLTRPTVCIVNSDQGILKTDYKNHKVSEFETMVFVTLPEGGGGGSNPLKLIATMALIAFAPGLAGGFGSMLGGSGFSAGFAAGQAGLLGGTAFGIAKAAVMIGGMSLINALIPPPKPPSPQQQSRSQASPVYSLQAQGNSARLDAAIPEIFGTHRVYPDFAAQPYTEYRGNEQYLYQLLCIGVGDYVVNDVKIEDTLITGFEEIDYEIVTPNSDVTLFPTNVETSGEVSGQELLSGQYVGGFVANSANTDCNYIGIDVVFPKGLFYANDEGGLSPRTISYLAEYRAVDDTGAPLTAFTTLFSDSKSLATVTPQRFSYKTHVALGRYEVRMTRTNAKSNDSRVGNDVIWSGMRAYIPGSQNYGNVTMLAMVARATNNLSSTSARKVNVSVSRKLETWSTAGGWSGTKVVTSKPAWIMAYICQTILPQSRFSLTGLEALQTTIDTRNSALAVDDEFNGVFDNKMSMWEALQLVAKSVRAMPIIQGGVIHFVRDQAQTIPTALFSMRNIVKGSFKTTYILPGDETADAVEVEYFDADSLKPNIVVSELDPGNSTQTAKIKMFGVTTREHAYREGMYHASCNKNRRIMTTFDTELEGYIPMIGDLVAVVHDSPNWGQSGEVVNYETYATNYWKITLSEPVIEGVGQHYIIFRDKDGSPTIAISCNVDVTDKTIVTILKADLSITLNPGDLGYEPTHYAIGVATEIYQKCRVIPPLKPKGDNIVEINVINEVDEVHLADTGIAPSAQDVFDLPAPIKKPVVTVVNATVIGNNEAPKVALSWTPAAEADHYIIEWRIREDTDTGYPETAFLWQRANEVGTNNTIIDVMPGLIDVRVAGVGLIQGDWISTQVDARLIPIPGTIQNLILSTAFRGGSSTEFTGTECQIEWDALPRAEYYKIEVYTSSTLRRTATTKDRKYLYSDEYVNKDGLSRSIEFRVYGVNNSGQSETYAGITVTNPPPAALTGVSSFSGYGSIIIDYDIPSDADFLGVQVYMSSTNGFTPAPENLVYDGYDKIITITNLPENTTQYFKLAAYDSFGKTGLNYTIQYSDAPATVSTDISNINSDITNINSDITGINSDITGINGSITTITGDITSIDGDITSINGSISGINTDITTINNSLTSVNNDITTINTTLTGVNNSLTSINSDITSIDGQITTINGELSSVSSSLTVVNGQITTINGDITVVNGQITSIDGQITTISGDIVTINNNVTTINNNINTINSDITALEADATPAQILAKLNQQLDDPLTDPLILTAELFAIKLDGVNNYPLIINNINGTNYIGLDADVIINGELSADKITAGELSTNTDITTAGGKVLIDGDGAIIIYDGDSSISNRDYAILTDGNLSFQQYWGGAYREYKSVKRTEYGTADSGTTVTLPGYWKTQPKVIVSPNRLQSYDQSTSAQSQTWHIKADSLREDPASSGIYKFDAVAELILSANAGTDNLNYSSGSTSSNTWNTSSNTETLPANTSEFTVNVSASSKRGTGADGVSWYYRKVSWRVVYTDTTTTTTYNSAWRDITFGAFIDLTVADSATITTPTSNVFDYYVEFSASDDTGDFDYGTQTYEYSTGTISSQAQTVAATVYNQNKTFTGAAYTVPSGWTLYQVKYQWQYTSLLSYANQTYGHLQSMGFTDRGGAKTANYSSTQCSQTDSGSGLTFYRESHAVGSAYEQTVTTSTYNRNWWYANNITTVGLYYGLTGMYPTAPCQLPSGGGANISINMYGTAYLKRPINTSTTAVNTFNALSTDWTLSGTSALATGSMNWMAIE